MVTTRSSSVRTGPMAVTTSVSAPAFPPGLVGKKVLLASESLGPINGVSRTTQSLIDYLRANGVQVATCAPLYKGCHINAATESKAERRPFLNAEWVEAVEKKSAALGRRALGGAWVYHNDKQEQAECTHPNSRRAKRPPMFARVTSSELYKEVQLARLGRQNPEIRLQGVPLPYNPDLTVAFPFRLGVIYDKTFKPDVIYLASPASVGFQFLVQLNQLDSPPPTLLNFQTDLSSYAGILFRPPLDKYGKWLLQIVQGYLFRTPAVRTIFYPSRYVRNYMVGAGAPADKMVQLGRGVDTKRFHPSFRDQAYRKQIAPNDEIIFAYICRLAPEKGFEFLAQAARRLVATGLKFKLLIVGGNKNPAVEKEVRDYFAEMPHHVVFTGMLRGADLSRAYASADIFLHCSITETFGLVVLESMASGVPVIARDEGGPSETVKHGQSGFLVAPDDVQTFARYAYRLATDAPLRCKMASKARQQALETTWDKINNQVAVQLAAALRPQGCDYDEIVSVKDYYGSWLGMARVYFAVGVVWIFWFIAVIPMLLCGYVHGYFR